MRLEPNNWNRQWNQFLLTEISFDKAKESLVSKKTKKMLYRHQKDWIEQDWPPGDKSGPDARLEIITSNFRNRVLNTIPNDLEDNQKATTVLWILRVLRSSDDNFKYFMLDDPGQDLAWTNRLNIANAIEQFFHYQRFMSEQDIMKIDSFESFLGIVDNAEEDIKAYQRKQDYGFVQEGTEVFRDDDEWYIAAIHNKSAACELGKETKWCTAHPGGTYFEKYYSKESPLFFVKGANTERYQVYYGRGAGREEFKGEDDLEVSKDIRYKLHDLIKNTSAIKKYPIIQHYDDRVKAKNPYTTPDELLALVNDGQQYESTLLDIAEHKNTPLVALEIMATESTDKVRSRIASHPTASDDLLKYLVKHDSTEHIKYMISRREDVSPEILEILLDSDSLHVLETVAKNEDMTSEMLDKMVDRFLGWVKKNIMIPTSVLHNILLNKSISPKTVEKMYEFPYKSIRTGLANHPLIPEWMLDEFATNTEDNSVENEIVASRPDISENIVRKLLKNSRVHVRAKLARNENIPIDALHTLSMDDISSVVMATIYNQNLPIESLEMIHRNAKNGVYTQKVKDSWKMNDAWRSSELFSQRIEAAARQTNEDILKKAASTLKHRKKRKLDESYLRIRQLAGIKS